MLVKVLKMINESLLLVLTLLEFNFMENPPLNVTTIQDVVYVITSLVCFKILLTLMCLAELRSGKHRLKLRYSKMLPTPYKDTDD